MVYTHDSKSCGETRESSNLSSATTGAKHARLPPTLTDYAKATTVKKLWRTGAIVYPQGHVSSTPTLATNL